jgi:hypothetical protein
MKHPNNVIEHDGWIVVRNERALIDIETYNDEATIFRYYNTYHEHRHERNTGFVNLNPVRVLLSHTAHRVSRLACECGETVPDTILGSLALIAWSDDNAIIR